MKKKKITEAKTPTKEVVPSKIGLGSFLKASPLAGSGLVFDRDTSTGRFKE